MSVKTNSTSKIFLSFMAGVMALSFPVSSMHADEDSEGETFEAESEIREKLDVENLDNNSQEAIDNLSPEAQTLYEAMEIDGEDNYITEDEEGSDDVSTQSVGAYYEYHLSPDDMSVINSVAASGGFTGGIATAIARQFSSKPTPAAIVVGAVGALGMAQLNACDQGDGVELKRTRIGATNHFNCEPA